MDTVASLLAESFSRLPVEQRAAYDRCVGLLAGDSVELTVDQEAFFVVFEPGLARIDRVATGRLLATVRTSTEAILGVLDDRLELDDAVLQGQLQVRSELDDLTRVHDALLAYAHGGVRSPSFPGLLARFRAAAAR